MASETLHFENARLAQQLFNNDPQNLRALENDLSVKATSREGWIKLDGDTENIQRAKQLFQLLEDSVKSGTPIRNREFNQALNVVKNEGIDALKGLYAEKIQTSPKKTAVVPKTLGQKNYVEAIRAHDVTFGVGPAGFGFNITGTADIPIVVEACTNLADASWVPLQSLNLTNGAFYLSDPQWTNHPARFFRLRSP